MKKLLILFGMVIALAGIASAATPVTSCGTLITSPGNYILTSDLTCIDGSSSTDAIRIYNTGGVTLDCKGYKITGDSFNGVVSVGRSSGVTVKNCEIEAVLAPDYPYPIAFMSWESSDIHVIDNTITSVYEAITFRNTKDSERRNNFVDATIGGWIFSSCGSTAPPHDSSNNIDRNNVYTGQYGTLIWDACGRTPGDIYGNLVTENCYLTDNTRDFFGDGDTVDFAIYTSGTYNNVITNNNFYGTVYTSPTPFNVVDFSSAVDNNYYNGNFWTTNEYHYIANTGEFTIGAPSVDANPNLNPIECGPDPDNDGVLYSHDVCPGSVTDDISLNPNQYAQNINFGAFEVGPNNGQSVVYDMDATRGCTCKQIITELGKGAGHVKKGCSPSVMEEWTGISANPDRKAKVGNK